MLSGLLTKCHNLDGAVCETRREENNESRKRRMCGTRALCVIFFTLTGILSAAAPANAADVLSPAAQRGQTLVKANCSECHAIDKVSESPLKIAPPFRTLHVKYPIETLRLPLREGVLTSHPTMPIFRLDPGQVEDVIAYLKTLEH